MACLTARDFPFSQETKRWANTFLGSETGLTASPELGIALFTVRERNKSLELMNARFTTNPLLNKSQERINVRGQAFTILANIPKQSPETEMYFWMHRSELPIRWCTRRRSRKRVCTRREAEGDQTSTRMNENALLSLEPVKPTFHS